MKDVGEEVEKTPPREEGQEEDKAIENVEFPIGEQQEDVSPSHEEEENVDKGKPKGETQAEKSLEIEQPKEHAHKDERDEEREGKEAEKEGPRE